MQIMLLCNTGEVVVQNISLQCTKTGLGQLVVQSLISLVTSAFRLVLDC